LAKAALLEGDGAASPAHAPGTRRRLRRQSGGVAPISATQARPITVVNDSSHSDTSLAVSRYQRQI